MIAAKYGSEGRLTGACVLPGESRGVLAVETVRFAARAEAAVVAAVLSVVTPVSSSSTSFFIFLCLFTLRSPGGATITAVCLPSLCSLGDATITVRNEPVG
eukprot:COSAG02_NODE_9952_length_2066_cov_1.398577_3_plen_100_part_01